MNCYEKTIICTSFLCWSKIKWNEILIIRLKKIARHAGDIAMNITQSLFYNIMLNDVMEINKERVLNI